MFFVRMGFCAFLCLHDTRGQYLALSNGFICYFCFVVQKQQCTDLRLYARVFGLDGNISHYACFRISIDDDDDDDADDVPDALGRPMTFEGQRRWTASRAPCLDTRRAVRAVASTRRAVY